MCLETLDVFKRDTPMNWSERRNAAKQKPLNLSDDRDWCISFRVSTLSARDEQWRSWKQWSLGSNVDGISNYAALSNYSSFGLKSLNGCHRYEDFCAPSLTLFLSIQKQNKHRMNGEPFPFSTHATPCIITLAHCDHCLVRKLTFRNSMNSYLDCVLSHFFSHVRSPQSFQNNSFRSDHFISILLGNQARATIHWRVSCLNCDQLTSHIFERQTSIERAR